MLKGQKHVKEVRFFFFFFLPYRYVEPIIAVQSPNIKHQKTRIVKTNFEKKRKKKKDICKSQLFVCTQSVSREAAIHMDFILITEKSFIEPN